MTYTLTLAGKAAFSLSPLSVEEIELARLLCDECVGENLYTKEEIAAAIGSQDRFFYLLKSDEGEAVGYIYYYLTDVESVASYAKLDPALVRAVCPDACKKVGKIQSVGLRAEHRGAGLASELIRFSLARLKEAEVDVALIVCWKPGGVVPLSKALAECRFTYLAEAKRVWYDDAELICPYCGGRCLCDAEVYYKRLDEERYNEDET